MAEHLRQIPQEMEISTGEVIASLPILGFAVGTYMVVDAAIRVKEKVEHVLVDFGRSKKSGDVAIIGALVALPSLALVGIVAEGADKLLTGGKIFKQFGEQMNMDGAL